MLSSFITQLFFDFFVSWSVKNHPYFRNTLTDTLAVGKMLNIYFHLL